MPSKSNQSGFIPILIVVLLAVIAGSSVVVIKNIPFNQSKPTPTTERQSTDSAQVKTHPSPTTSKAPTSKTSSKQITLTPNTTGTSSNTSVNFANTPAPTNTPTPITPAPSPTPTQAAAQVTIVEFSPHRAYNNEIVSIFGSNLGTSGSVTFEGKVYGNSVGDFLAEVVSWQSFRIQVKVPAGNYNTARLRVQTASGQTLTLTDDALNNFTFIHSGY